MKCLLLIVTTVLAACSSMKDKGTADQQTMDYRQLAESALGDSLQYSMNLDSTMVLCQRVKRAAEPPYVQQIAYCVIDIFSNQIIHEAHFANGSVTWHEQKQLLIRNFRGYPTVKSEGSYIYDLKNEKRIKFYGQDVQKE